MRKYNYKVVCKQLDTENKSIDFDVSSHENLFEIVEKLKSKGEFKTEDDAKAFAMGLKFFTSVVLENRSNPFFENMMPHIGEIMKIVKGK